MWVPITAKLPYNRDHGRIQMRLAAGLAIMVFCVAAFVRRGASVNAPSADAARMQTRANPDYRLQIYPTAHPQLPAAQDWTLEYRFVVPPLPASPTWNYKTETVYQWGDVDFDAYGARGEHKLSDYVYNQIVPELEIGNVLDASDAGYRPYWHQVSGWQIEAQYYWRHGVTSTSYAQAGAIVKVNPGDEIITAIHYAAASGTIIASVADASIAPTAGTSTITISRPFPNDPSLFTSWAGFFKKATAASHTPYVISTPAADVEPYNLDQQTMCGLLPFRLHKISIPGVAEESSAFSIHKPSDLSCKELFVQFRF
jgi:hypothetical protein